MPDKDYRDGYKVLLNTTSRGYADFNDTIYKIADMAPSTLADTAEFGMESIAIPASYNGQQIYVGFDHDANDQFILYLTDFTIVEAPLSVNQVDANEFFVGQNAPNPFKSNSTISYQLTEASDVSLKVFDVTGKLVLNNSQKAVDPGKHKMNVDGSKLSNGVYFYTLTAGSKSVTKKMMIVK
jgi:hypothetical protein